MKKPARLALGALLAATLVGGAVHTVVDANAVANRYTASRLWRLRHRVRTPGVVTTTTTVPGVDDVTTTSPIPTTTTTQAGVPGPTTTAAPPAPTTTAAPAPTTTVAQATTTTAAAPTTTAAPPAPTPAGAGSGCRFSTAVQVAFCETFDAPAGGGTRTGDLDPVLWGVSRVGNINPGQHDNDIAQVQMSGCGTTAWSFTPNDVRICNGQMFEAVNDGGGVASLHAYPKQPFDFAGRTGTVTFDVSADSDGSHGAWPEFVITDKPVPGARVNISGPPAGEYAVNEVGVTLDGCTSGPGGSTGVGRVYVSRNGVYADSDTNADTVHLNGTGCVTKGSAGALNHFEVRISQNRLEVWGTDPGGSTLKQLAVVDNLNLTFTKGLVWLDDVHYNARKAVEPCECGTQWNHTFAWDNLGFDGPKTYRDLGFDVPDANIPGQPSDLHNDPSRRTGVQIGNGPVTFTVAGVHHTQTPTGALVVLNTYSFGATIPSVSINGNAPIATPFPPGAPTFGWLSIAIPVPLDQTHDGANTITLTSGDGSTTVANISLIIVAGSPVP